MVKICQGENGVFEIIRRELLQKNKGTNMEIGKAVGRPNKVSYRTIIKLADSIQHNATITEACEYAGISRDTYYRHMNNRVFAEKMKVAHKNQNKAVFSFLTTW